VSSSDLIPNGFPSLACCTPQRAFRRSAPFSSQAIQSAQRRGSSRHAALPCAMPMVEFIRSKAGKYCLKNRTLKGPVAVFREGDTDGRNPVECTASTASLLP
jgi:hypothetical protein